MKCKWPAVLAAVLVVSAFGISLAQEPNEEISLVAPDLTHIGWGTNTAAFAVTNHTNYLKFIVVQQNLTLVGASQTIQRVLTSNYALWPGQQEAINLEIAIPGVFGTGSLLVTLYDVVDTLDELYAGYDIFQKNILLSFPIPEALAGLGQDMPAVPPRVDVGMDFGADFPKLMMKLLAEGKSPSEIARIAACSESFVQETIDSLVARQYLVRTDNRPELTMPYISAKHGDKALSQIAPAVLKLADQIAANLVDYRAMIDSLVVAGVVSKDSNDFIDPGTVIYRQYAMVVPWLLWYDLGQDFVTASEPLMIFAQSDPCNAWDPRFMYLADQGRRFAGTQYYWLDITPRRPMKLVFSDHTPQLDCPEQFWLLPDKRLREQIHWNYPQIDRPENFLIDTGVIQIALRHLRNGLPEIITGLKSKAEVMGKEAGAERNEFGYHYWFWNLVATNVTNELVQRGVLTRPGNGNLRFEVLE